MSKNRNLCVVITVHKPDLALDERVSLRACKTHLSNHDCYLVFPSGLDISQYRELFGNLIPMPVDPSWLSSVEGYNKMKLSAEFYNLFSGYNYMLTYELDAYIFSGDLEQHHAFDFDYIGAPFFRGYWQATPESTFMPGCNSGFSVRNIRSCLHVLRAMKRYRFHWLLYRLFLRHSSLLKTKLNELTGKRYDIFITGKFAFHFDDFHLNEDVVWSEIVPQLFPSFIIADSVSALKFSFEYNLEKSLMLNNDKLPLGCHAWYKHKDFWKKYIDIEGQAL